MPPLHFPLRWESTGDQWWYACPIDYAAANGHYESTRELLRLDANNLIKFTSLRRIRRLETVWDDNEQFHDVAKCRSQVARKLYLECETKQRVNNSLIRAGYGGWLLYTAASAGDLGFTQQLLQRDPLLVFGEGEYGVTDILYAAARSRNFKVFKLIFEFAASPRFSAGDGEIKEHVGEVPSAFKMEMISRAMHAAARGGDIPVLKYLLQNYCSDILGSTVLHAAASKGQVQPNIIILLFPCIYLTAYKLKLLYLGVSQVIEYLISSYLDLMNAIDSQANSALHIAAYKGQLSVVECLVKASPSTIFLKNNAGETFLHMAVYGFKTHAFRRMDQQSHFMQQLVSREFFNIKDIINDKNRCGRTALHQAIIGNIHSDLVQLLMTVGSIDVNVRDSEGMTPLDHLRQQPASAFSERLTRELMSAGGICSGSETSQNVRKNMVILLRALGIAGSPGTSFKISDAEILLNTGRQDASALSILISDPGNKTTVSHLKEVNPKDGIYGGTSVDHSADGFKRILHWPRVRDKKLEKKNNFSDVSSITSAMKWEMCGETPVPLRPRFSKGLVCSTSKE